MRAANPDRRLVFVDTSAIVAVVVRREEHHTSALALFERLGEERRTLVTTNLVVAEMHAFVLSRSGRADARAALRWVDEQFETIRTTVEDEVAGRVILDRYTDRDFSLTDAVSFAVMDRLRLRAVFAFDRHFAQYGLDVLTAE